MEISIRLKRHQETNDALPGTVSLKTAKLVGIASECYSFLVAEPREDSEQVKLQFAAGGNPSQLRRQESTPDITTLQTTQAKVSLRTGACKFYVPKGMCRTQDASCVKPIQLERSRFHAQVNLVSCVKSNLLLAWEIFHKQWKIS